MKERSIGLALLFSIITFGIYAIYWQIDLVNKTNKITGNPQATSGGLVFLFSIITINIYLMVWMFKNGNRLDDLRSKQGELRGSLAALYLVLTLFGMPLLAYCFLQHELNKHIAKMEY